MYEQAQFDFDMVHERENNSASQSCLEANREVWKDIEGYSGIYQVSTFGNIRRIESIVKMRFGTRKCRARNLKVSANKKGYKNVMLCVNNSRNTTLIHRIVAKTFIPNPDNKPHVNHKDGDPRNNNVSNLEWATVRENELHKIHVLNKKPSIKNFKNIKQTDKVVRYNGRNIYGIRLQNLLKQLITFEYVKFTSVPLSERQPFYKSVFELKNRFGVPIKSMPIPGTTERKYLLTENDKKKLEAA